MQFDLHGTTTIQGSKIFKVPGADFMVSPFSADTDIYINGFSDSIVNPVKIDTMKAGEYTKVTGNVPNNRWYVNTNETFYVTW